MKHLAKIHSEFVKSALRWNDLSYDVQREYLKQHPKTKKRLTARPAMPTNFESWVPGKTFMNLETKQRAPFNELPVTQQEAIRKQFEQEKANFVPEVPVEKVQPEKLKKFTIMGAIGEGDIVRAKDAQDAMAKYLAEHEQYSIEQATKLVQDEDFTEDEDGTVHHGNYEIKEVGKKKKKMTERKVKRLGRKVRRDIKGSGKEFDGVELEAAKSMLDLHPELKEFFQDKGVAEEKMPAAFADYIGGTTNEPEQEEIPTMDQKFLTDAQQKGLSREQYAKQLADDARHKMLEEDNSASQRALRDYVGDELTGKGVPEKLIKEVLKTIKR